ncbi:hypothetical protein M3X99_01010 [Clostridium perfringens]|uniref:hypothetical protein n=1 Tax=Clostridium perfringens TaxID=1502 RepID=UPI002341D869|nr:hypothetical protein [Clostridium perfringens]MDC4249590.1 hypothetical protein [Clostridium perfringens]
MNIIHLILNLSPIISIGISAGALILSLINFKSINRFNKLKSRPIFFIRSTYEERSSRKVEIEVDAYRDDNIVNIEFVWVGTKGVKLEYKKKYIDKERLWDYILFLSLPENEKEIKGRIIVKCSTMFEKKLEYNKKVYIENKYYPLIEESVYELRKIASSEFEL